MPHIAAIVVQRCPLKIEHLILKAEIYFIDKNPKYHKGIQ
jgi:hypothetical protein